MTGFNSLCKSGALILSVIAFGACSGGAPPSQTITPDRVAKAVPTRDASGTILTTPVSIPEGTEFSAQTMDFLSSQSAVEGDPVRLQVNENVLVNGAVAIGAGSPVKGVISAVHHASRMGKAGSISIQLQSAEAVDGQRIRVRATKTQGTDDKVGSVVALTLLVSPLFLLKKGNDVAYQPGTHVTVFTDEKANVAAWKQ